MYGDFSSNYSFLYGIKERIVRLLQLPKNNFTIYLYMYMYRGITECFAHFYLIRYHCKIYDKINC